MNRAHQIRKLFRLGARYREIDRRMGGVPRDEYDAATRIMSIQIAMEVRAQRASAIHQLEPEPDADIEPIDVMFTKPLRASRRRSREEEDA